MEKNYYDILEINRNASQEIVEKAYKTLAKKYHPDLQDGNSQIDCEAKMKELNEAYEVISNPEKRALYDSELAKLEEQSTNSNVAEVQQPNDEFYKQEYERQEAIRQAQYEQQMQNAVNKAYHDAYIQDLKNRGYKIRYKKTFKDYLRILITLFVVILALFLLFQIPFIKNIFIQLYQENDLIRVLVDAIANLFK